MGEILAKYIENRKGQRCGVIVGQCVDGELQIGWSHCNLKVDKYTTNKRAREIALFHAVNGTNHQMPHAIAKLYDGFVHRCLCYFKQATHMLEHIAKKDDLTGEIHIIPIQNPIVFEQRSKRIWRGNIRGNSQSRQGKWGG